MEGTVVDGAGRAKGFVPGIETDILETVGFRPYPGTLNLRDLQLGDSLAMHEIEHPNAALGNCQGVKIIACALSGIRAAVLKPLVPDYPSWKSELVSPVHLRSLFALDDGDRIAVSDPDKLWRRDGNSVASDALDEFDALVFDLDGTLIDLEVDWEEVREEIRSLFEVDPFAKQQTLRLEAFAREHGRYAEYEALLRRYETKGARFGQQLPLLSIIDHLDCEIAICTKNATQAAEYALEEASLVDAVDFIAGRETTVSQKPEARPLLTCLEHLNAIPGNSVFVGNERTDCETAKNAGTSFLHPIQIEVPD